ncbi:radical SAM protein [Claveliimonas sp.]|uniref:radical SAM/SPASM domain-containing protein n=1 Tax=Claveliimonas sp. TaxID=3076672 RepID=UPI00307C1F8F
MKATVYCLEDHKMEIREAVSVSFPDAEVKFAAYEDLTVGGELLAVDHELVHLLKKDETAGYPSVYVYFKRRLFAVSRADLLEEERETYVKKEDWDSAKDINEVLCDIDFLCKNTVNRSYPDFFQIESTDYCNSKCIMCEHYFTHNKQAEILSMETLEHMRDAIQLSRRINLNGMGEPFISKLVKQQIDLYVGYGNKIVANTNLSVLDDELIERIGKDFEWLAISIDGASKETYESIRIGMSYETLISNLYKLKERVPHVKKIISMVMMRQNVCEMPLMVELAHKAGADQVVFLNLNPNLIIGNAGDVMLHYPKVTEYYSVKALEKGEELGIHVVVANAGGLNRAITFDEIQDELTQMRRIPMWKTKEEEQKMLETAEIVNRYIETHDQEQNTTVPTEVRCSGVCDWLLKNCYTNLHGDISMCCRNLIYRAGNVSKEGEFLSVWNAPLMQKSREIFYSGYVPEACLKCGMIEGGELKYLTVDISPDFYQDTRLKKKQKQELKTLLGE